MSHHAKIETRHLLPISTFFSLSSIEPDSIKLLEKTGGVPPPQHPAFVQSLAWPTKAVAKQASEAVALLSRTEKVFETTKSKESSLWERWKMGPFWCFFTPTTATRRGLTQIRCPHVFFFPEPVGIIIVSEYISSGQEEDNEWERKKTGHESGVGFFPTRVSTCWHKKNFTN